MSQPRVSVIIPTYNRYDLLRMAVASVINQTFNSYEIIVVDDGSTDSTSKIKDEYGNALRYFYKNNAGVSSARNFGIGKSNGEFIAFLDSDDEWRNDKLEKQVNFLDEHKDIGMVLCNYNYMNTSRQITGAVDRRQHLPYDGSLLVYVMMSPWLIPSSLLIRKNILDEVGYFDESLETAEDLDLHIRVAAKHQIGLLSDLLLNILYTSDGLSQRSNTYDDNITVIDKYLYLIEDKKILNKIRFNLYSKAATGKLYFNEYRPSYKYFKQAILNIKNDVNSISFLINYSKLLAKKAISGLMI